MAEDSNVDFLDDSGTIQIDMREQGTTVSIELVGEWDIEGCPAVRRAIAAAFGKHPECVVLDLSRLTFIDSSGLQVTMELASRAENERVRLAIIATAAAVMLPFEICGLTERLPIISPLWSRPPLRVRPDAPVEGEMSPRRLTA